MYMYWKTQTGKLLEIKNMESSHINNCINMLERQLEKMPQIAVYIGNSDFAEQAVEAENKENLIKAKRLCLMIETLKKELASRTIKKSKFESLTTVIQVCHVCQKIDVTQGHEKECNPIAEKQRVLSNEYYD